MSFALYRKKILLSLKGVLVSSSFFFHTCERKSKVLLVVMTEKLEATIKVKAEHHKLIIGTKGVNIQEIRKKSGAEVLIPQQGSKSDDIKIVGKKKLPHTGFYLSLAL
jgi:ribosomal protein S3